MDDYDRGYRTGFRSISGDRKLEIVSGKVFSANRSCSIPRIPPPPELDRRSGSRTGGSAGGSWCFSDPEMKRRRRVASYKAYTVEGKVKASIRKSFRWIKGKCSSLVHGW